MTPPTCPVAPTKPILATLAPPQGHSLRSGLSSRRIPPSAGPRRGGQGSSRERSSRWGSSSGASVDDGFFLVAAQLERVMDGTHGRVEIGVAADDGDADLGG